jgi:hypothetical protein
MAEVFIVVEKDAETGVILSEITACAIDGAEYVAGLYCVNREDYYECKLLLTAACDIADELYDDIFDLYDGGVLTEAGVTAVSEVTDYKNPVWEVVLPFAKDKFDFGKDCEHVDEMERVLNKTVQLHRDEITAVFEELKKER